ncbi:zf-HC2 domain-containing protein [Streptomyces sp. NEAU-S77]|uniref:zf-HC2 domain-containing protein n=1 Tax=Streptomyces sp. NEAU-S77 TaxID=3411033 RepID=UPI003BA266E8
MHCSRIRTAVSARLDGEEPPPGITAQQMGAHLDACAACREWEARARALTAHIARLRDADTDPGAEAPDPPPQAF